MKGIGVGLALATLLLMAVSSARAQGSFVVGPGSSGEWALSEGGDDVLLVHVLPGGIAWVAWLDHDEEGRARRKEGTGAVLGSRIVIDEMTVPSIPPRESGEQRESDERAWGRLVLNLDSCETGTMGWDRAGAGGRGSVALVRAGEVAGMPCDGENSRHGPAARGAAISGLWQDEESSMGVVLQQVPEGDGIRPRLILLTFDEEGRPTWRARWGKWTVALAWLSVSGPVRGRDDPEDPEGIPMLLRYRSCNEMWAVWVDPATQRMRSAILGRGHALAATSCAGWKP